MSAENGGRESISGGNKGGGIVLADFQFDETELQTNVTSLLSLSTEDSDDALPLSVPGATNSFVGAPSQDKDDFTNAPIMTDDDDDYEESQNDMKQDLNGATDFDDANGGIALNNVMSLNNPSNNIDNGLSYNGITLAASTTDSAENVIASDQDTIARQVTKMKDLQRISKIIMSASMENDSDSDENNNGNNLSNNTKNKPQINGNDNNNRNNSNNGDNSNNNPFANIDSGDQTAEILKVLGNLSSDQLTGLLELFKNFAHINPNNKTPSIHSLTPLSSAAVSGATPQLQPMPLLGMQAQNSLSHSHGNNNGSGISGISIQQISPQQQLTQQVSQQVSQQITQQLSQGQGAPSGDLIIKMISDITQSVSGGDVNASGDWSHLRTQTLSFDPFGRGLSNSVGFAPTERQYDFDVTFMVSMPLLGQGKRDPIEVLAVHEEEDALRMALQTSQRRVLKFQKVTATVSLLRKTLTLGTRILHFCGHGVPKSLVFESGDKLGVAQRVPCDGLQKITEVGGDDGLMLVFLSACHSEGAAQAFVKAGAKHVVAIKRDEQMHDAVARSFTEQFYTSLVQGKSVRESFDIAKQTLATQHQNNTFLRYEHSKFILRPKDKSRKRHNGNVNNNGKRIRAQTDVHTRASGMLSDNNSNNYNDNDNNVPGLHDVIIFPKSGFDISPQSPNEYQSGKHYPASVDHNGSAIGGYMDRTKHSCLKKFVMPPKCFIGRKRLTLVHNLMDLVYSHKLCVLQGKKWVGKTALVNKVCHYLWERNKMDGIFVFNSCQLIIDNPKRSLAYLLSKNMRELGNAKDLIPPEYCETNYQFTNRLRQNDKKYLLVFEDIDQYNFGSFRPNQRLDTLLSLIIEECFKCHVLVTISTAVNRLDFLNRAAHQNGIQLNVLTVPPFELKESEALINERLSLGTFSNEQRKKIDIEKLANKCHGLPGLIFAAIQFYNHKRNQLTLEDSRVLQEIDDDIDKQRKQISQETYYKWITLNHLSIHRIRELIHHTDNVKLWRRMFGLRSRGDTKVFVNELFALYKRLVGDNSKWRIIEDYEKEFISHELIPYTCEHRQKPVPYTPYDQINNGMNDSNEMKENKSDDNNGGNNNGNNNNNNNKKNNNNNNNNNGNDSNGGNSKDAKKNKNQKHNIRGIFKWGSRQKKKTDKTDVLNEQSKTATSGSVEDERKNDPSAENNEILENTKVPIEVFEEIIKFWSALVNVIMNPKIKKYYIYGSAIYEIRKSRQRSKNEKQRKDNYLKPMTQTQLTMSESSSSMVGNPSNSTKEIEMVENHYRIIIGLITKEKARQIISKFRLGTALIRFSRTTPGALAIVVSRGINESPATYRIKTNQTPSNELVFTFDSMSNKVQAKNLYNLIEQIASIKYVYTHRNGNVNDEKLVDRHTMLQWLKDPHSN